MKLLNRPTNTTQYPLALSAVQSEDDELIQAIEDDHKGPDDMWDLNDDSYAGDTNDFWENTKDNS